MKFLNMKSAISSSRLLCSLLIVIMVGSCVTSKKTTYLQEYKQSSIQMADSTDWNYRVQVDDNLFIRVITPDPRWATMFNTLPVGAPTMSVSEYSMELISYIVLPNGCVEVPYLGPIFVAGKTLAEIQEIMQVVLADYVTDAAISVRLVNNYVSVIGDVARPGRYPIFKQKMNIFHALALAGDMDEYGDRYNVNIIRETKEGTIVKNFDLTDKEILDTEFFYVMPNDVIYAQPLKGKFFQMNSFPYALILSTISTTILLMNYIND